MAVELQLVKSGRLLQHVARDSWSNLFLQVRHALAERQTLRKLDEADQVAAATATVAIEQILAAIDVERRPRFAM